MHYRDTCSALKQPALKHTDVFFRMWNNWLLDGGDGKCFNLFERHGASCEGTRYQLKSLMGSIVNMKSVKALKINNTGLPNLNFDFPPLLSKLTLATFDKDHFAPIYPKILNSSVTTCNAVITLKHWASQGRNFTHAHMWAWFWDPTLPLSLAEGQDVGLMYMALPAGLHFILMDYRDNQNLEIVRVLYYGRFTPQFMTQMLDMVKTFKFELEFIEMGRWHIKDI